MYENFSFAYMRTIRGWKNCCLTAGPRRILRQSSPIGSTNPEPKPLAPEPAALIAAPAVPNALRRFAIMDRAGAYENGPFLERAGAALRRPHPQDCNQIGSVILRLASNLAARLERPTPPRTVRSLPRFGILARNTASPVATE